MDDYALSQAKFRAAHGVWGKLVHMIRNWQTRRSFKRLRHASDYQLRDIGLTRLDLDRLASLPLSIDAGWEAESLRLRRSRGQTPFT